MNRNEMEANRNIMRERIAPGIWIDANGDTHFSIPELLQVADMPDTPQNRALVTEWTKEFLKTKLPGANIISRATPDE